jgi:hypothetical protein
MSITVIQDLSSVMPIGNPMALRLQTDNLYTSPGSKATLVFTFTGIDINSGHAFTICWNSLEITFTLATSPDDSGNQVHKATGGQAVDAWMAVFAADLMCNYYLDRDFEIAIDTGTDKITLTARETGSDYSVTVVSENLTNVALAAVAGTIRTAREGYELLCRAWSYDGSWSLLSEDRISPDTDEIAEFDFHDLFLPEQNTSGRRKRLFYMKNGRISSESTA